MKMAFSIIGAILVMVLFGTMMAGMKEAQTDEQEDDFGAVVTAPAATTADVVLTAPLYGNELTNVVEITSDLGTDVPLATDYTALTRTLEVSGLDDDETRTLTVTYLYGTLDDYAGVNSFFGLIPLLVGVVIVIIIVAAMVGAFRNR